MTNKYNVIRVVDIDYKNNTREEIIDTIRGSLGFAYQAVIKDYKPNVAAYYIISEIKETINTRSETIIEILFDNVIEAMIRNIKDMKLIDKN